MGRTIFGNVFHALAMTREYKDGDTFGFVWRWWNPLVYLVIPPIILFCILFAGIPETFRRPHELGFGVNPYFARNNIPLEWV